MPKRERTPERIGKNDATFREANERIGEATSRIRAAAGIDATDDEVPFLCECAEERCTEVVRLSLDEYEAVRANATDFLNAPGHEAAAGPYGEVVSRNRRYVVVRKKGPAADVVEALDPRAPA